MGELRDTRGDGGRAGGKRETWDDDDDGHTLYVDQKVTKLGFLILSGIYKFTFFSVRLRVQNITVSDRIKNGSF